MCGNDTLRELLGMHNKTGKLVAVGIDNINEKFYIEFPNTTKTYYSKRAIRSLLNKYFTFIGEV